MGYKPTHAKSSATTKAAARGAAVVGAAAIAAGAAAAGIPAAGAATAPLPVTLSASSDGASATWVNGDIALKLGTDTSSTYAQAEVDLGSLGDDLAPSTPPSFTTDNYAAGSPRWVIELANGNWIDGYPSQLGGGATDDFSGNNWAVGNSGTYETYAKALAGANDALGNVKVTNAYIVADGDQAPGVVDTLTNVQYDGENPVAPAPVPVLSDGHVISVSNNRFTVGWKASPAQFWEFKVTIHGPGALNGHVGYTSSDANGNAQGTVTGAEAGHTYTLTVQTLDEHGNPAGKPGTVTVVTTRK